MMQELTPIQIEYAMSIWDTVDALKKLKDSMQNKKYFLSFIYFHLNRQKSLINDPINMQGRSMSKTPFYGRKTSLFEGATSLHSKFIKL